MELLARMDARTGVGALRALRRCSAGAGRVPACSSCGAGDAGARSLQRPEPLWPAFTRPAGPTGGGGQAVADPEFVPGTRRAAWGRQDDRLALAQAHPDGAHRCRRHAAARHRRGRREVLPRIPPRPTGMGQSRTGPGAVRQARPPAPARLPAARRAAARRRVDMADPGPHPHRPDRRAKPRRRARGRLVGQDAVLGEDGDAACSLFARTRALPHHRLNPKTGPRVISTAFHIQTINNLHSRLASFMTPFCGPATKNLSGDAAWFIARLTGDEFGRTRTGLAAEALRACRRQRCRDW